MLNATISKLISVTDDSLTLEWGTGIESLFHAIWLRDNARGPDARHPDNDQRLFDISELPDDVTISGAKLNDVGDLNVTFGPDGYQSTYTAQWLADYAYDSSEEPAYKRMWDTAISGEVPKANYAEISSDDAARARWLRQVDKIGFSILEGVPCEEGMVCKVAEIFGFLRVTNYGSLFDVRSEENPVNLAYTGLGLNVHTDNPYRDPVPGLQLLHCLEASDGGGESILMDGFKVAATLRDEAPEDFKLLCENWIPFRYKDSKTDLQSRGPIIEVDDNGRLQAVRYNNRSAAPFKLPADIMPKYYKAFRRFAKMLHRPQFEFGFRLGAGDLMIFDNRRILHGRKGFSAGKRHLQGCYADKDSLRSEMLVLEGRANG